MKKLLFLSISILFSCWSFSQEVCLTQLEMDVVDQINETRVFNGLPVVEISEVLMLTANKNVEEIVTESYLVYKPEKFGLYTEHCEQIRAMSIASDAKSIVKSLTFKSSYTNYSKILLNTDEMSGYSWKSIGISIREDNLVLIFGEQSVGEIDISLCDSERYFGAAKIKDFPILSMVLPEAAIMQIYAYTYSGEKVLYEINTQSNFLNKGDILELPLNESSVASFEFIFRPRLELIVPAEPATFTIGSNERGVIEKTIEFSGNSVSDVEAFLKTGININRTESQDYNKYTMLHRAVRQDNFAVAEYLIEKGAAVNKTSEDGETAIHFCQSIEMFDLLMNNSADVNTQTIDKTNILHSYAINGLLEPIRRVVYDGLVDVNSKDRSGGTPLLYAVQFGQVEVVEYLLESGAKQLFGWQVYPIHYACEYGNLEIAKLLVKYGADVNAKTGSGSTPLYYAKLDLTKNTELIEFLIENGAK